MTKDEFTRISNSMRSIYTYQNFISNSDAFEMWYEALKKFDYKSARAAIGNWTGKQSKAPTPADIVGLIEKEKASQEVGKWNYKDRYRVWLIVSKTEKDANGNPLILNDWAFEKDKPYKYVCKYLEDRLYDPQTMVIKPEDVVPYYHG